jgi:hypothetical protein
MTLTRSNFPALVAAGLALALSGSAPAAKAPRALVVLHVDASSIPGGDGTRSAPFQNIPEAVSEARLRHLSGASRLRIQIAPGVYVLGSTLRLDVPGLELRGSNVMPTDPDDWPTGLVEPGTESRVTSGDSFNGSVLIHTSPSSAELTGQDVTLEKLTIDFNRRPTALLIERVQGFTVKGCLVTRALPGGIQSVASSGTIAGNYITGSGCGVCVGGGNESSPANVRIVGNRSVGNANGGVLLDGGNSGTDDVGDRLAAVIQHNDLSDNIGSPNGFGLRVFSSPLGPFLLANDNHVSALVLENRIRGNRNGVVIDAGFPYRAIGTSFDPRLHRGSADVTLRNNDVAGNVVPALITFTRSTAALVPTQLAPSPTGTSWKYLQESSFRIHDPLDSLAGYWLDHPEFDPIDGRQLQNALIVNGREVATGRTIPSVLP